MHGVEIAWHGFLKLDDNPYLAFVQTPEVAKIERTLGVTHSGNAANPMAGGVTQHIALNVADADELLAMRDRIRSRGVDVIGPIDHGLCQPLYFAGPGVRGPIPSLFPFRPPSHRVPHRALPCE